MFKIGLSHEINKDSFNCNLNGLLSFKSIEKLSKLALWPSNNIWSKIADFLGVLTNLPVKSLIPRCSESHKEMYLSLTIISCIAATTHKFVNNMWA